jgi:hypothetical protein
MKLFADDVVVGGGSWGAHAVDDDPGRRLLRPMRLRRG